MAAERSRKARLVLASGSPRRRDLIAALDLPIDIVRPDVREGTPIPGEPPGEFVRRLSLDKARQVALKTTDAPVLAADTVVVLDGEVLGKPTGDANATWMLRRLRSRPHSVLTGMAAIHGASDRCRSSVRTTEVVMRDYSDAEVAAYVASGEPADKAGAYAVQDRSFRPALETRGCYLNVVGLPLCDAVTMLREIGLPVALRPEWRAPPECSECPLEAPHEVGQA